MRKKLTVQEQLRLINKIAPKTTIEDDGVQMTFGKHQGKFVSSMPTDYLIFVRDTCKGHLMTYKLKKAIALEIERKKVKK